MRAELWTADGGFVAAFDVPPFQSPPPGVAWGERAFVLDGEVVHLVGCDVRMPPGPKPPTCNCGGAYAYKEIVVYALMDMHKIEKGRDKPITREVKT